MTDEATPVSESRSSFKLIRNATGKVQIEVKTYALGGTADDEVAAREAAIAHYNHLNSLYPPA